MIDHVTFYIKDMQTSLLFYDAALSPLGYTRKVEMIDDGYQVVGYGGTRPHFWIVEVEQGDEITHGLHIALSANSRRAVDAFYQDGLSHGGKDNGAPGLRTTYSDDYYAAFLHDPDGNNIEAVTFDV
ncbi:glyoxalase/bleomycin resistance/extradiol dioxygenase family protein [Candidatus Gracilibacteria bacterium CG17_big_fil_post_rev_8_21_14_2_50_48_13]|nr:MAG: glyoxalase/bleomycin resistance/extradiol dioxygenase family protein [Candidatus Gracilibacteria bacterium CG17_big_fil_post_rev_8_21_14_2_50_48_13]